MYNNPEFYIKLNDKEITLHGSSDESAGFILRGSVNLKCSDQTKVKAVSLKFIGTSQIHWTEGVGSNTKHFKEEHTLIEKDWVFLSHQKKPYHLSQGTYRWEFELPIPGNLLESIQHDIGKVSYYFKAICERPTFSMNLVDKKTVKVKRLMLPSNIELNQSVIISSIWADKVAYDISIPSKVFTGNTSIPISFDLTPIAPNLKIRSVRCCLKEYVTFTAQQHSRTEGRLIQHYGDPNLQTDSASGRWTKIVLLHVPDQIIFDMSGKSIQVRHKLKFTVALENSDGHISELRASIPIVLSFMIPEDDGSILPAYEDAIHSIPYTEDTVTHLIAMGEIPAPPDMSLSDSSLSISSTISSSSTSTTWLGADMNRVPSYTTAILSSQPCDIYPSLPNYESL